MAKCGSAKDAVVIGTDGLDALIKLLAKDGYDVIGPRVESGAVVLEPVDGVDDLPAGWADEQDGGHYRLTKIDSPAIFEHVVGPHTWKRYLSPPAQTILRARKRGKGFSVEEVVDAPKYALLGVRACDLKAISLQDRVFDNGDFVDKGYFARRNKAFVIAVNCTRAAGTCFCVSMNSGPEASCGFDLGLTEILTKTKHVFLLAAGSERGRKAIAELKKKKQVKAAAAADRAAAAKAVDAAAKSMKRKMRKDAARLLAANREHPRWEEVATRCLSCANCTMVCPTCFCSTVEDVTDLKGKTAERVRRWDSCFTHDFSYIHGGTVRRLRSSRYRHWITHKLSTWHDQFQTQGCVGCGRCITWCPVGIDITEEVRELGKRRT